MQNEAVKEKTVKNRVFYALVDEENYPIELLELIRGNWIEVSAKFYPECPELVLNGQYWENSGTGYKVGIESSLVPPTPEFAIKTAIHYFTTVQSTSPEATLLFVVYDYDL